MALKAMENTTAGMEVKGISMVTVPVIREIS